MRRLIALAFALALVGCANLQGVYTAVTTTTVSPGQALIVANAYDALKITAANYKDYCIAQHFPRPLCSASNRRIVIKAVQAGDPARAVVEGGLTTGQPIYSTVYNTLVAAVNALQASQINKVTK